MTDQIEVLLPPGGPPPLGALPAGLRRRLLAALCAIDEQERAGVGEALPGPSAVSLPLTASGPSQAGRAGEPERAAAPLLRARTMRQGRGWTTTFERQAS